MATYYIGSGGSVTTDKKKKKTIYTIGANGAVGMSQIGNDDDDIAPAQQSKGFFQAGATKDGVSAKSVGTAAVATGADAAQDATKGGLNLAERIWDGLVALGPLATEIVWNQSGGYYNIEASNIIKQGVDAAKAEIPEYVAQDLIKEDEIAKKLIDAPFKKLGVDVEADSWLGERSDSLVQTAADVIGRKAISAVIPGSGYLITGLSSVGGEAENAFRNGASYERAVASGMISAAAEIGTEALTGGIKFGGKTLTDKAVSELTSKISNKTLASLAKFGINTLGEGIEEPISGLLSAIGQKMTYMSEAEISELFSREDAWNSFVDGMILGGAFEGASILKSKITGESYVAEGEKSKQREPTAVSDLTSDERTVFDYEVKNRVEEKEKNGKKVTAKDKKAIEEAVVRDIEKGYIATDVIEEALGGEDYKAYKEAVDSEDAIRTEFEELGKLENPTLAQQTRYQELYSKKDTFTSDDKRNELKTSLGEKVRALTDGSRLGESYVERARRSQAFAADLAKYSEKQRVIVQKAIDSGVLNNTNRSHEFVDTIARFYEEKGISFDFTNNKRLRESGFAIEGVTVNGYVTKDGITINMDSPKAWQTTVGHEITHVLEGTELYTTLQEAIFKYTKRAGTFYTMKAKMTELYKNIEGADISKELTAELVGEYLFTDENFVKHLSVEHRNVFQRIYDEIKYLMKVVTAGSKEARQLEAVKHTFEKIYREGAAQKNTVGDGEVRYSISPTLDSDLDAVLNGTFNADKSEIYIGETSNFMTKVIGAQSLSKTMPASKVYAAMVTRAEYEKNPHYKEQPHYHGLGKETVIEILEKSENPIAAFADTPDADGNSRLNRIVLVTNVKVVDAETRNEGYAVVIEEVDTRGWLNNKRVNVNKDITIYPMDRIDIEIQRAIADKRILDIKKQGQSLAGVRGAKSQAAIQDTILKNNISNFWANVKWKNEKNKTFSSDSPTKTLSPIETALQKAGLLDQDGHTQSMQNSENDASDVEELSLSSTDEDLAPVGDFATPANELRYEGERGVEDVAPYGDAVDVNDDIAPIGDDVVIKTTAEKLTEKRNHSESERESLTAFREANAAKYDKMIADKQAEYDALKNKDSKKANAILQSIERLKRLKGDIDADYAKKIGNSEARISRLDTELSKDHTRKDKLTRAYARIDRHLEADKASLKEEFEAARKQLTADLADEGSYVSRKADTLYQELRNLKKGVRASDELGYLLDYGYEWNSLKTALLNIRNSPGKVVNQNSAIEGIAREMLAEDYVDAKYELENIDNEYARRARELEDEADRAREDARREMTRSGRAQRHEQLMNDMKARFSEEGYDLDEVLRHAKDLSTFATVDNTPQRVMEKSLGYKEGGVLADMTVNKVAQNESEGIRWLNRYTDRKNGILRQLSKKYNIKPESKESAAAQMYAEGFYVDSANDIVKYGDAELAADFPSDTVRQNIKLLARDPLIRQIYDDTLEAINASRVRNAYPEIQRLDNYFLHFRAMDDTFSRLGLPFNPNDIRAKDLPTDLNGVTADLKPGQPYFASAKHREGIRTSFDLLGGLESYLTSAKNQIYHIDDIQALRALRNYIADGYGQARGLESLDALTEEEAQEKIKEVYGSHLSTFAKFLNEEANVIAGKTALIDRGLEGIIGRRGMTFISNVNKQVGANQVGYNISSSLTNFLAPVQAFAKTNKFDFIKGFAQTVSNRLASIVGKGDGFADKSDVMVRREGAQRFHRTAWQKLSDPGYALMGAVDSISTEIIARAKVNEYMRKGMSEEQAHREADKWTSRLMGDRSLGQQPQIFNSKMLGLVTKYQLEVRNQLDAMFYDTIKEAQVSSEHIDSALARNAATAAKVTAVMFELAVGQHIFGKVFESIAGYNPAFDIIDVLIKALGFDDEEDDEDTALDNLEEGFQALLDDLPYTSTFTGGRIPISSALPIEQFLTGKDDYGNEKSRLETLAEAALYYLMPGGYGQIKKTAQGLSMFDNDLPVSGSYTDSGKLRFPVEETPLNVLQAAVFGQWASENARDYFDNERSPLTDKQVQEYIDVDMPIREYHEYRDGLKGLSTLAEKADYIAGLDLPVDKKNILINNIADRKEPIDMTDYDEYGDFEEFDFAIKNPEKYALLEKQGISYSEYKALDDKGKDAFTWACSNPDKYAFIESIGFDLEDYARATDDEKDAWTWAYKNPDKYEVAKVAVGELFEYRRHTSELNAIGADKDANGKSISGSAKTKKIKYINSLDLDYGQKLIFFKSEYPSDDTYNREIVDYLNSRDDISYEQMKTILEALGFTVSADGRIS